MNSTTLSIETSKELLETGDLISKTQKNLQSGKRVRSALEDERFISRKKAEVMPPASEAGVQKDTKSSNASQNATGEAGSGDIKSSLMALAAKLKEIDPGEEAVNLLALQTRQQLAVSPASLAESAEKRIIDLFS
ncbi:MAG: hypothetical protein ACTSXQ_00530 [Alphaproteobacteria bacterium]